MTRLRSILTCPQEEYLVVAIRCHDLVHGHGRVSVLGVGANHQGSPPYWVNGVEHNRVISNKRHHIVRELLCCLDVRSEGSTRALKTS